MPCTTILVGKNASYDGSTMMARNEDSPSGVFTSKKFTVINPKDQPRHYVSKISKVEIELPDNPMRVYVHAGCSVHPGGVGRSRYQ